MEKKDTLLELIQSLSKSEKRYFKIMASRFTSKEENNNILLFDFIDKHQHCNETLIIHHFKKESFVNYFAITKKRLYDQILKSLENFHAANNEEALFQRQIHEIEILMNKNLNSQALKELIKLDKQTKNTFFIPLKLKIHLLKAQLNPMETNSSKSLIEFEQLQIQLKTDYHLKLLKSNIEQDLDHDNSTEKFLTYIDQISNLATFENHLLILEKNLLLASCYLQIKSNQKALTLLQENELIYQKNSVLKSILFENYLTTLSYLHQIKLLSGLSDNLSYYTKQINFSEKLLKNEKDEMSYFFTTNKCYFLEQIYLDSVSVSKEKHEEFTIQFNEYKAQMSNFQCIELSTLACLCMIKQNQLNNTKYWLDYIHINSLKQKSSFEIEYIFKLIEMILILENPSKEIADAEFKKVIKSFKSTLNYPKFEHLLTNCIQKIIKTEHFYDHEEIWLDFIDELANTEIQSLNYTISHFNFMNWAINKSKNLQKLSTAI